MRFIPPPNGSSYFEVSAIFWDGNLMTFVATLQIYGNASINFILASLWSYPCGCLWIVIDVEYTPVGCCSSGPAWRQWLLNFSDCVTRRRRWFFRLQLQTQFSSASKSSISVERAFSSVRCHEQMTWNAICLPHTYATNAKKNYTPQIVTTIFNCKNSIWTPRMNHN